MNSVIKATSYVLAHAPDMITHNGTTQTTERLANPDSDYLKVIPKHLRSYEQVLAYAPNQVYIGNMTPSELETMEMPWYEKNAPISTREGKLGEIMPQDEFYLLMQICDVFDLLKLDSAFVAGVKDRFISNPVVSEDMAARVKEGVSAEEIARLVSEEHAEGLYQDEKLVGCVTRAHDVDVNLSAHVMHENLVSKAGAVHAIRYLLKNSGVDATEIEYVIDCSEEACGDMNQRGGGNFAKASAEIAGLTAATGSDTRGFCAGPSHALVQAAALVKAGAYKNVVVAAGGCTAKLGMNGKSHVAKDMPLLEDVLGGFAVLVTQNDGVNPEINLDVLGRHTVGTGSAAQAVTSSLVSAPLERNGMTICDIDKYSVEMQNPEITVPAGAGDVPLANYKMIGALAVKQGEIEKAQLATFPKQHGMIGWAPTQGHIPSGVPYLGFARQQLLDGEIKKAMIIGKGSLFLARMTNLFDGVSVLIQPNSKSADGESGGVSQKQVRSLIASAMRDFASAMMQDEGEENNG